MYISPQEAIDQGWIKGITNPEKQIQPNAIDFTLDKLYTINREAPFVLSEEVKVMRGGDPVEQIETVIKPLMATRPFKGWKLDGGSVYDGMSDLYVELPEGVAAELIVRSTLNRNGIFITSGLYDSGFKGNIGFAIHNRLGSAFIAPGTRIGQIKFIVAKASGLYAGGYNTEEGQHHSELKQQ